MTTLMQARQLMQAGNFNGAREIVYGILRADPNNPEAWQMAVELAPDDNARVQAHQGLQRAMANRPVVPPPPGYAQPYQQPYPQQPPYMAQPMVVNAPGYGAGAVPYRAEKDYIGEALITLLLYFFGVGLIGMIANALFLINANRDRENGVVTRNVGCLQAMMVLSSISLAIAIIVGCVVFALPIFLALGSGGF